MPGPAVVLAMTASLAASAAATRAFALAATRTATDPGAGAPERVRTSRAARAAARLATSESVEDDTPSQTTRTAWPSGAAERATASSLRVWRTPRSQTAATHGAGCSLKWLRSLGARAPHCVQ